MIWVKLLATGLAISLLVGLAVVPFNLELGVWLITGPLFVIVVIGVIGALVNLFAALDEASEP